MGLSATWRHKTTNETEQNPLSRRPAQQSIAQLSSTSGSPGWRKQFTSPPNGHLAAQGPFPLAGRPP
jgi:hypothetical protein